MMVKKMDGLKTKHYGELLRELRILAWIGSGSKDLGKPCS